MTKQHDVLARLGDLEGFMTRHGVTAWADELRKVRAAGATDRLELKRRVLDMYRGSMGSLTDLIVSRVNGHDVDDETTANAELDRKVHELWVLAQAL
jgi:hypothetical protein